MLPSLKELVEIKYKLCICGCFLCFFLFSSKYVYKMLGIQKVSSLPTQHPFPPFFPRDFLEFRNPFLLPTVDVA